MKNLSKDFIQSIWFKNSLQTILPTYRRKGGYTLTKQDKEELKLYLFNSLDSFPIQPDKTIINKWYHNIILYVCERFKLTVGRSQKLINILIKYHITTKFYFDTNINISNRLVQQLEFLHIPIDRVVLKFMRLHPEINNGLVNYKCQIGLENSSWSEINDILLYQEIQNRFRLICENQYNQIPLILETSIWNKSLQV